MAKGYFYDLLIRLINTGQGVLTTKKVYINLMKLARKLERNFGGSIGEQKD